MDPFEPAAQADGFLNGQVRLRQPARGYRAGMDAVLLAAAIDLPEGGEALEIGCGAGAALLCAAWRNPSARFLGVEREPRMAALAAQNAAENGMADRVCVLTGDPLNERALLTGRTFDAAFCNPPFNAPGRAPAAERVHAYLTEAPLEAWVKAFVDRLRGGAALTIIHRAEALPALLSALEGRLGGVVVTPIRPQTAAPAHRVIVRAEKGSRAPFRLAPELVLHAADGARHTAEAEAILRGERGLWEGRGS
jgi:tRNA1(Val) A37 N6-methylase TrmN6